MGASGNSRLRLEHRRLVPGGVDSAIAAAYGKIPNSSGKADLLLAGREGLLQFTSLYTRL